MAPQPETMLGSFDDSTELVEDYEEVYAEMSIDQRDVDYDISASLKIEGSVEGEPVSQKRNRRERTGSDSIKRVMLWYRDYHDFTDEYAIVIDIDTTLISGRIVDSIPKETADEIIDRYPDRTWDYVE